MQINVSVTDANNIVCEVTPPQPEIIVIDRGVAGNGIVSIVPVTISTFQYLRITYTNGTVQDVGPLTSTAYTATSPITIVGNTISLATVPIASGGTDATTAAGAIQNLLPSYTGNGGKRLGLNSGATALEWVTDGGGTVTSVSGTGSVNGLTLTGTVTSSGSLTLGGTLSNVANSALTNSAITINGTSTSLGGSINVGTVTNVAASGGTTGLTFTGSPITTSGTLTLGGTLTIANGGTGQTTANAAFNALAPTQTGNSGKYLTTDGTDTSWATNPLGTVTSVAATVPSFLSISGSPITTSGTLAFGLSGTALPTTSGGTGLTSFTSGGVVYASSTSALTTGSALTFDGTTLNFGGATQRLTADTTGATINDRFAFVTNQANSTTRFNVAPSGTGSASSLNVFANSNLNNASVGALIATTTAITLSAGTTGTGAFLPLLFATDAAEQMRLTSTGLSTVKDATIQGVTVGRGAGAVSTNTAVGASALAANTTGGFSVAVGQNALALATDPINNTAVGHNALASTVTGSRNTAVGVGTLALATSSFNTAVGASAMTVTTTGEYNAGFGRSALGSNTTGGFNTAIGALALQANTTASYNTAVGYQALYLQTNASNPNVAVGRGAGYGVTTGGYNTIVGELSGYNLGTGISNTFIGVVAGYNSTGSNNTFIGSGTSGYGAGWLMTTGSNNTILGAYSGNQGGLDIRTSNNYAVISDGDGNPLLSTRSGRSIALEGAVPEIGEGITFPATQNASSNANTLDDYEEGTWTPTVNFDIGGTGIVYGTRQGTYTKIGRVVTIAYYIEIASGVSSSDFYCRLTLPFSGVTLIQDTRVKQWNSSLPNWALSLGGSNPVFFYDNGFSQYATGADVNGRTISGSYTYWAS